MELDPDLSLVIFDFDGTLFHLDVDWGAVRSSLGLTPDGGRLGEAIQRMVDARDPRLDAVTRAEVAGVGARRVATEVTDTLRRLSHRCALAVCTRNSRHAVERAFAGTPMATRLTVVGREDAPRLKPDPSALRLAMAAAGAPAEHVVVVGDTFHDVDAARAAGARCVVVANERLARAPTGADHYIGRITELPALLLGEPTLGDPT